MRFRLRLSRVRDFFIIVLSHRERQRSQHPRKAAQLWRYRQRYFRNVTAQDLFEFRVDRPIEPRLSHHAAAQQTSLR